MFIMPVLTWEVFQLREAAYRVYMANDDEQQQRLQNLLLLRHRLAALVLKDQ